VSQMVNYVGVEVRVDAESTVNSSLSDSYVSHLETASRNTLFALRYSDPYSQRNETKVVAYLDRKESLQVLVPAAESQQKAVEGTLSALSSGTSWGKLGALAALETQLEQLRKTQALIGALDRTSARDLNGLDAQVAAVKRKSGSQFGVKVIAIDPLDLVAAPLVESLNRLGVRTQAEAPLVVSARFGVVPVKVGSLKSADWTLEVSFIEDKGKTWFSAQTSGKASGATDEALRARIKIDVDRYLRVTLPDALKVRVRSDAGTLP